MKRFIPLLFSSCVFVQAQAQLKAEEALQKVFTTLSLQSPEIDGDTLTLLQNGAWEALSYLESTGGSREDLQEAVPDYYRFFKEKATIKLINPKNTNEYGMEIEVAYRVNKAAEIELLKNGAVQQRWQILYLDQNYMALDMGALRVFFTHTPPQE